MFCLRLGNDVITGNVPKYIQYVDELFIENNVFGVYDHINNMLGLRLKRKVR